MASRGIQYLDQWAFETGRDQNFQVEMLTGAPGHSTFRVEFEKEERAMGQVGMWDVQFHYDYVES